jgi:aspartyl-tRNA(Asn)/glutamyl-tRNA(Gln) amidotransferase subunit A
LPIALQVVGRPWDEARILALGRLYQENTDWHRRRPPTALAKPA